MLQASPCDDTGRNPIPIDLLVHIQYVNRGYGSQNSIQKFYALCAQKIRSIFQVISLCLDISFILKIGQHRIAFKQNHRVLLCCLGYDSFRYSQAWLNTCSALGAMIMKLKYNLIESLDFVDALWSIKECLWETLISMRCGCFGLPNNKRGWQRNRGIELSNIPAIFGLSEPQNKI